MRGTGTITPLPLLFCLILAVTQGFLGNIMLSISSINCNSLNMASIKNQDLKLHGITSLKTDIILLSDIRLSNKNLVSCASDISKKFLTNNNGCYEFFFNSTKNKRGVGILINKNLDFAVESRWEEGAASKF
jgi:exonuclease III